MGLLLVTIRGIVSRARVGATRMEWVLSATESVPSRGTRGCCGAGRLECDGHAQQLLVCDNQLLCRGARIRRHNVEEDANLAATLTRPWRRAQF